MSTFNKKVGMAPQAGIAIIVFIINVSWTAWYFQKYHTIEDIGTIYVGNCDVAQRLDLWLHLAINILSALLLGSSNYCMQFLVAPSREEIDKAHQQQKWLDIGVPSVRNLKYISKRRVIAWVVLGISSTVLSLLYVLAFTWLLLLD